MVRHLRAVAFAAFAAAAAVAQYDNGNGTVYKSGSTWTFKAGVMDPSGVAWATYTDMANTPSAFGDLSVTTNSKFADTDQMYGAGEAK